MTMLNRRRFLQGAVGLTGGVGALGFYSTAVEAGYRLELTPYTVSPPGWPEDLTLKIAIIADIHACEPWMPAERVATIVDLANAQQPDLIVLLGDFVGNHRFVTGYVAPGAWAAELARLAAPLGVYSVLGNHDWWTAAIPTNPPDRSQSVRKALASAGIPVLENDALRLSQNGKPFWLIGLGDQIALRRTRFGGVRGVDDLAAALRPLSDDAPAILLAHEPFIFPRVPDRVALTLCGHTHGGQVYIPFIGAPFAPTEHGKSYVYGCYNEGPRQLIVSGGLGESAIPVRFLRPPEVVSVTVTGGGLRQSV